MLYKCISMYDSRYNGYRHGIGICSPSIEDVEISLLQYFRVACSFHVERWFHFQLYNIEWNIQFLWMYSNYSRGPTNLPSGTAWILRNPIAEMMPFCTFPDYHSSIVQFCIITILNIATSRPQTEDNYYLRVQHTFLSITMYTSTKGFGKNRHNNNTT